MEFAVEEAAVGLGIAAVGAAGLGIMASGGVILMAASAREGRPFPPRGRSSAMTVGLPLGTA